MISGQLFGMILVNLIVDGLGRDFLIEEVSGLGDMEGTTGLPMEGSTGPGSQKGRSLISAYQSLAITTNTPGFEKLNTALLT